MSIEVNGKKLYRVDVEERRSTTFYVLAGSQAEADTDAKLLGGELDNDEWDEIEEVDVSAVPAANAPTDEHDAIWTGGEEGEWREWGDFGG